MELIIVGSSSQGNSYVLTASDGQQLCIEAGRPLQEVKKMAKLKTAKCVGVLITHAHSDHSKYVSDFLRAGINVYSTTDLSASHPEVMPVFEARTYDIGNFRVTPIRVKHDIPCLSYLVHHKEMGTLWFFTDCYTMPNVVKNVDTFLCECNYDDSLLDKAVQEGKTPRSQADRIRLSHMSLSHAVELLQRCEAEKTAKQIILIHGSSRHLNPLAAVTKFQQVIGVPTFYAEAGLQINLM